MFEQRREILLPPGEVAEEERQERLRHQNQVIFEKYFILFSHLVSKVCWLPQERADADRTVGQDHDGEHDESDDGEPLQLGDHW